MYINFMIDENKNIYISYWLLLITILVALMIIVGGLTRLTDSGLSITRWDLFSGIIPPLSLNDWEKSFSLYKEIPEYKYLNASMTLDQFKIILKNIRSKSIKNGVDPKITIRIWKAMIWGYVDYQRKNFKRK